MAALPCQNSLLEQLSDKSSARAGQPTITALASETKRAGQRRDRVFGGAASASASPESARHPPRVIAGEFSIRQIWRKPVLSGLINEYERAD